MSKRPLASFLSPFFALILIFSMACTRPADPPPAAPPAPTASTDPITPDAGADAAKATDEAFTDAKCIRGGCSANKCLDASGEQLLSTCEWKPEYACYRLMDCKPDTSGKCAFVESEKSAECFKNPPKD